MAKYKQGYADRQNERYAMKMRYGGGVMGHDKKPQKCNAFEAQKSDLGRLQREPQDNRGYPREAWDYKY